MGIKSSLFRLTRSAYRRKLIMAGVSTFASLAMVSSGFAAWVLSKDAAGKVDGNVTVGAVQEANIEIEDLAFVDESTLSAETPTTSKTQYNSFIFEPKADDTTGRVRRSNEQNAQYEDMGVTIAWTIKNYQTVGELTVDLKIPASVKAAIDRNYLELPAGLEWVTNDLEEPILSEGYYTARYEIQQNLQGQGTLGTVCKYEVTESAGVKTASFLMTIEFGWGSEFGRMNPGLYFDNDTVGKEVDYETLKATLNEFKATMHGITYDAAFEAKSESDKEAAYEEAPIPQYRIEVVAKVL